MTRLILDIPVSLNKMYMPSHGLIILTPAARSWKEYAKLMTQSQWQDEPMEGELVVFLYFFGSRLDADNGIKLLFDSLNGVCWHDDSQVSEFHVYVSREKKVEKRVEIEIQKKQGKTI